MPPRFTIIQGGLPETAPRASAAEGEGRPWLALVSDAPVTEAQAPGGWRVILRRPSELHDAEIEEWRALAARRTGLDPFSDPDFLATAALHVPRGNTGGVAFAMAYATSENGIERLRGVIPLTLPGPVRGGTTLSLWHAPLSPRLVEPVFDDEGVPDAVEAVLGHLARTRSRTGLRLTGLKASGGLVAALRADPRFRIETCRAPASIPEGQFVTLASRETVSCVERITGPDAIRDAVERFLLLDVQRSRRPILPDPAIASTLRVVSRLFARRGLIEVELNSAWGEVVSGAIRLGCEGKRVTWRSVNLDEAGPAQARTVDIEITLSTGVERAGAVGLA
ncbi:hypothetical protein [Methylobacterium gnaphalii]|uniref:Uncharacterized protein n=1 Tax=Methylobacterium gnaphalii TaxID=1010610 RepID=A0A512JIZ7_9HYPH|nr:hypothetical protein [Methylobacterium gnaphalii]GEP09926.1 hypothetical protein MGN01_17710 [Methylobacterium gnaphalii]GJD68298.1 hypothetical protein MMMDOFMJ_1217 [Methylobacterium gnaphalii]GLS51782.1 hypothetical protein GCM10007885_46430 [Methylobacterium gnaphalii]